MTRLRDDEVLAFCHIEKAAGTSLIHILRRIFFLKYAAVRPMYDKSYLYLTARDLRTVFRFNPFLKAIGGHSVVPHGNLMESSRTLRFITQLRDPVGRAASQFRFWNSRLGLETNFDEFLSHPTSANFQVKKIAGGEDLDLAMDKVRKHFLLVGTVSRFDEFLVLLSNRLGMPLELFTYAIRNVQGAPQKNDLPNEFLERLAGRNQLDQQLYDWVDQELIPEYVSDFPGDFAAELTRFRGLQQNAGSDYSPSKIDFLYRNAYLKPVSSLIRLLHGLPAKGSYSAH